MKAVELREKSASELEGLLLEILRAQFNLRMQKASDQLSQPADVRRNRRDIARIKTVLKEMETIG